MNFDPVESILMEALLSADLLLLDQICNVSACQYWVGATEIDGVYAGLEISVRGAVWVRDDLALLRNYHGTRSHTNRRVRVVGQ
jgi:hypothetical protein